MDEDRLIDIDVKLAYQERLIRDLDDLVRTFGKRLDEMKRELDQLKQSVAPPPVGPQAEKPPHY